MVQILITVLFLYFIAFPIIVWLLTNVVVPIIVEYKIAKDKKLTDKSQQ